MKLSKYVALAKRESFCRVIHVEESGVWLGLRGAFYRATELPDVRGGNQVKAVLDIPDKAWGKIFFEEDSVESESNIYGVDMMPGASGEQPATELDMQIAFGGISATALVCADGGLVFYDSSLTSPISDVMKESVQAALSVVRARALKLGIDPEAFSKTDWHIHFPEGAVPKDGPSAGAAITTALASAITGIAVRSDIAMTGEITLRGEVLEIGGLKEKLLAAVRAGIKKVLIPEENVKDLEEVPDNVKQAVEIVPVRWIDKVLEEALVSKPVPLEPKKDKDAKEAATEVVPPEDSSAEPAAAGGRCNC